MLHRARQGLVNGVLCSESVILSGFVCEVAVDVGLAEKSAIYLELSQYCVVLCQRGLIMMQTPAHSPDLYRLAACIRVNC